MADIRVAMDATYGIRIAYIPLEEVVNLVVMAFNAIVLEDFFVLPLDHDGLVKFLCRKALRVMVAVLGFRQVLGEKGMWQMAVDTGGNGVVAGFLPGVVLRIHDMAVGAGFGIRAEVGKSLGIPESERSGSHQQAQQYGQYDRLFLQHPHSPHS